MYRSAHPSTTHNKLSSYDGYQISISSEWISKIGNGILFGHKKELNTNMYYLVGYP